MSNHAKELRRNADKVGRPSGDIPAVMHQAAAHIEDLERRLRESEARVAELESELRDDHWPNGATVKLRWADGGYYRKHGWAKRDAEGHLVTAYSGDRLDESMWVVVQERKVQPAKGE